MLPQDLICNKLAFSKGDICEINSSSFDFSIFLTQNTTMISRRPVKTQTVPRFSKAESDAGLWSHSLICSEHFNLIFYEKITLLLFSCPAAEARQMSPNGTGINNAFDYCYYSASGAHVLLLLSLFWQEKRSVGLSTSEAQWNKRSLTCRNQITQ